MITAKLLRKAAVALAIGGAAGGAVAGGFTVASAVSGAHAPASTVTGTELSAAELTAAADPATPIDPATISKLTAASTSGSGATGATPAPEDRRELRNRLARRVMHGEFVVRGKDGKPVDLLLQRGEVTAATTTSITLKSPDGFTATYPVGDKSRVRVDGQKSSIESVKVGNKAGVVVRKDNGALVTLAVVARS